MAAAREELTESTPALSALNVTHVKVEIPDDEINDDGSPNTLPLVESHSSGAT